jgi:transcription elongation factor GreA
MLFKDEVFHKYLEKADQDSVKKCVLMIKGSVYLDEKNKLNALEPYKEDFADILEKREIVSDKLHGFLVTREAYNAKKKQLENLLNVEMPKNSKEIGEAQEKGDLRENAEYQSALEKQKTLQTQASKLDEEINKAKIILDKEVDITKISVGCKVSLVNLENNETEVYTILGEWDSKPEENIISYKSPFGKAVLGFKVDQKFDVKLKSNEKKYKVASIELAQEVLNG